MREIGRLARVLAPAGMPIAVALAVYPELRPPVHVWMSHKDSNGTAKKLPTTTPVRRAAARPPTAGMW